MPAHRRRRAAAGTARDSPRPRHRRDAATAALPAGEILVARRGLRRDPERPAHGDRSGDRGGIGRFDGRFAHGRGRGATVARSGRGRAARTIHTGRERTRMVRQDAAGPHSSLHAEPAPRRDRAGQPGRFHAVPLPVAACRNLVQADRAGRAAGDRDRTRRLRARGRGVGARGAAGTPRSLRRVDARHYLPHWRGRVGRLSPAQLAPSPDWCRRRRSPSSSSSMPARGGHSR